MYTFCEYLFFLVIASDCCITTAQPICLIYYCVHPALYKISMIEEERRVIGRAGREERNEGKERGEVTSIAAGILC